ncbi:Serpin_1 [Hexamita inflata]|uniref:Serpin 1 n=1 Tax=Hexamita inflata TaxID=28002 RepID=A0AA86UGN0_9EUKA|nr:Serpin 1 [Hexamita inflata]
MLMMVDTLWLQRYVGFLMFIGQEEPVQQNSPLGEFSAFNAALCEKNLKVALLEETTTLELPRFKIESKFFLKEALTALGVKKIFNSVDCTKTLGEVLQVQDVIQKTFMEVNEEGTEAAAVTAIIELSYSKPVENKQMICDKPFWFLLVNEIGGIVFATSVVE